MAHRRVDVSRRSDPLVAPPPPSWNPAPDLLPRQPAAKPVIDSPEVLDSSSAAGGRAASRRLKTYRLTSMVYGTASIALSQEPRSPSAAGLIRGRSPRPPRRSCARGGRGLGDLAAHHAGAGHRDPSDHAFPFGGRRRAGFAAVVVEGRRGAALGRAGFASAGGGAITRASPVRTGSPSRVTTVSSTTRRFSATISLTVAVAVRRSSGRTGETHLSV
jgi:hypothetical protein